MKKFVVVLSLLLCSITSAYGQKTRFGQTPLKAKPGIDYPIKVHISGIHIRPYCTGIGRETSCTVRRGHSSTWIRHREITRRG
jgi:hypothetical protein